MKKHNIDALELGKLKVSRRFEPTLPMSFLRTEKDDDDYPAEAADAVLRGYYNQDETVEV